MRIDAHIGKNQEHTPIWSTTTLIGLKKPSNKRKKKKKFHLNSLQETECHIRPKSVKSYPNHIVSVLRQTNNERCAEHLDAPSTRTHSLRCSRYIMYIDDACIKKRGGFKNVVKYSNLC